MTKVRFDGRLMFLLNEEEYNKLITNVNDKLLGRKDIAQMRGISTSTLSESPWLLPNFGKGKKGKRNEKWLASEVVETMKYTPSELKEMWKCSH